jgi:hypothetical protein
MNIILAGSIGRFMVGGHAWINIQYLAGLRDLEHDVYYMEDVGDTSWTYDWQTDEAVEGLDQPAGFIRDSLEPFGFSDRWIYRTETQSRGLAIDDFRDICSRADLLIVRGAPLPTWRREYRLPKRRIFIDVDPGFTQAGILAGDPQLVQTAENCDRHFSIGQRIGEGDCQVPDGGYHWEKTISPVWLPGWPVSDQAATDAFSTIMQWKSFGGKHTYARLEQGGLRLGQKGEELMKFLELPTLTDQKFRVALEGGPVETLSECGWEVVPGWRSTRSTGRYRDFIQRSKAEFSIAKQAYVSSQSGWFSDRSVCYLASGRPVLLQDTGLQDWLPVGKGLNVFRNLADARAKVDLINESYTEQSNAARALAEEVFSSERVLTQLLERSMN